MAGAQPTSSGPFSLRKYNPLPVDSTNMLSQTTRAKIVYRSDLQQTPQSITHSIASHRSLGRYLSSLLFNMRPSDRAHIIRLQIRDFAS